MLNQDTGYVLDYFGQNLKTVDGGNTWNVSFQINNAVFSCISFKTAEIGLVFGGNFSSYKDINTLLYTQDGGEHWSLEQVKVSGNINDFVFITERSGIACAGNGAIFKIDIVDSKTITCVELTKNTGLSFYAIDGYNDSCLIAATNKDSTILITTSGGNDWNVLQIPCQKVKKVFYFNSSHITLVGDRGQLYNTSGLNTTWSTGQLLGIPYSSSKNDSCAILTNNYRKSFLTENAGVDWKEMSVPFTDAEVTGGSFIYDLSNIWAFTNKGRIAFSDNKGESWSLIHPDIFQGEGGLKSMIFIDDKIGILAGQGPDRTSLLYKTTDGGYSWVQKNAFTFLPNDHTPIDATLNRGVDRIVSGNKADIWFITMFEIFHSSDSGETWISQAYPQFVTDLTDIYCSESGNCWVTGGNWSIFHYQPNTMTIDYKPFSTHKQGRSCVDQFQPYLTYDLLGRCVLKTVPNNVSILKTNAVLKKKIKIH